MGNTNTNLTKDKHIYNTEQDPCHKKACEIQTCLSKNNFSQEKCKEIVDIYNDCMKKQMENKFEKEEIKRKGRKQN